MPNLTEPLHPPYNVTQPRQLNRWLDVNSQNGALSRTRQCVLLPAIQIVGESQEEQRLVINAVYKFRVTNNFSFILNNLSAIVWPNDSLVCVACKDSDGTIYRYSLNSYFKIVYSNSVLTFVPYEGQMIKKNFRIEYWSIPAILNTPIYLIDDDGNRLIDDNGNEITIIN